LQTEKFRVEEYDYWICLIVNGTIKMPIKVDGELIKLTQKEFSKIAYEVVK